MFVRILVFSILFVLGLTALLSTKRCADEECPIPRATLRSPRFETSTYTPFKLQFSHPTLCVPDLKRELLFYGKCNRPDVTEDLWHVGVKGGESLLLRDSAFLSFYNNRYELSQESSDLWIEIVKATEERIELLPKMRGREGEKVILRKMEAPKKGWEIGNMRVDGTLLFRSQAKWFGQDLFLSEHGGDLYPFAEDRERIDWGEGESCFVAAGEGIIWKEGRWQRSEETVGFPLLFATQVDDERITFELWDPEGKQRTPLALARAKSVILPHAPLEFVAAKSWTDFVLDAGNERLEVELHDWLLLEKGSWHKLTTAQEIDEYVAMERRGELLVIEGLTRQEGRRVLVGHLFDTTRTSVRPIEIPLSSSNHSRMIAMEKFKLTKKTTRRFKPLPQALEAE